MLTGNMLCPLEKTYKFLLEKRMVLFCIGLIIIGLLMLSYAFSLQQIYSNAPSKHIDQHLEGFALAQNETEISIDYLLVGVSLEPPKLALSYNFEFEKEGTYYILFKFPFQIIKIDDSGSTPLHASFQLSNNRSRGSLLLVTIVKESSTKLDEYIHGTFTVEETFISGRRGEYFVNLRFTYLEAVGSLFLDKMGFNVTEEYAIVRYINATNITNFALFLWYPEKLTITYASPQFTIGPFNWYPPPPNMTSVTWFYKELDPRELSILVYYRDSNEYDHYQLVLFSSGIWYGLSFSVILTGIFELIKTLSSDGHFKQKINKSYQFVVSKHETQFRLSV